jgi:hypothetical protein
MSINALTNAAVARRSDFQPEGAVPTSLAEIANAAVAAPVPVAVPSAVPPAAGGGNSCRNFRCGQRGQHGATNAHNLYPNGGIDPVR